MGGEGSSDQVLAGGTADRKEEGARPIAGTQIPLTSMDDLSTTSQAGTEDGVDMSSQAGLVSISTTANEMLHAGISDQEVRNRTTVTTAADPDIINEQEYLRPILVGYAFGPKKMSTMGVVMAEASRALSTVTMAATRVAAYPAASASTLATPTASAVPSPATKKQPQTSVITHVSLDEEASQITNGSNAASSDCFQQPLPRLTPAALERKNANEQQQDQQEEQQQMDAEETYSAAGDSHMSVDDNIAISSNINTPSGIRFSIAGGPGGDGAGGIRNIIRFFQSNCSSAASFADSSITTATAAANTGIRPCSPASIKGGPAFRSSYSYAGSGSVRSGSAGAVRSASASGETRLSAVRVSFVPLDLDAPLEEQHGGKFDAILHKMTEDILFMSERSRTQSHKEETYLAASEGGNGNDQEQVVCEQAQRVGRLAEYKSNHPACCLVDHPSYVQALMSRSDIANILSKCLMGVTTRSGVRAGTPRFFVADDDCCNDTVDGNNHLASLVNTAPFSYPIIVKPLTAAGTKASHHMLVVLNRLGLSRVQLPCILQEYANHDGVLYKVYVLGDTVRVFPRNSLSNLPKGERLLDAHAKHPGHVEFDSQRPYPKLSDFGVTEVHPRKPISHASNQQDTKMSGASIHSAATTEGGPCACAATATASRPPPAKRRRVTMQDTAPRREEEQCKAKLANAKLVTADEIRPIATALHKAFGLELFGFDILVTEQEDGEKTMLVVDVNYFPSYKEMSSFPSLLAQFLTQRAVEGRMRSVNSR